MTDQQQRDLDHLNLEIGFRSMMSACFGDQCDGVGIEQETDMRRAFFAGSKYAISLIQHSGFDFEDLHHECDLHIAAVKKGMR